GMIYLFGGGDGVRQLDSIIRVDPGTGAARTVGRLPAGSSDSAATALGGTAYVVGGYTGTRWLDTILGFRPGAAPPAAGRLPTPSSPSTRIAGSSNRPDGSAPRSPT